MLKPKRIFESGSHLGHATYFLGLGAKDVGGWVWSAEPVKEHVEETRKKVRNLPVTVIQRSSLNCPELAQADFIFSDSDYKYRAAEIGQAKPGATILVHDTKISYDSTIPPLEGLVRELGGLTFDTYRGFGLIRKR